MSRSLRVASGAALVVALLPGVVVAGGSVKHAQATASALPDGLQQADAAATVPGQLLVRFRPGTPVSARVAAREDVGARLVRRLPVPGLELVKVGLGDRSTAAAALEERGSVRYVEPNFTYRATTTPDDPDFASLWGLDNTGQRVGGQVGVPDADIDAPEAWETSTGDSDVTVAVVDTGVAYDHPDLAGNVWVNADDPVNGVDDDGNGLVDDVRGWDFVDGDNEPRDFYGHGTHVAGTIGAVGNNSDGTTGVAWDVSIVPVRVLGGDGSGTTAAIIEGIAYAGRMGADVVNMSLGGPGYSQAMADEIARWQQTLIVAAAGNSGANTDSGYSPAYPCNYPAANLLCVAATDNQDRLAGFSNYGTRSVDLGAPGVSVHSTVPDEEVLLRETFDDPGWSSRWTTGGTAAWGLEGSALNRYLSDSPAASYLPNADTWVRTTTPVDLSGKQGCALYYSLNLSTQLYADPLWVEASADGTSWTFVDLWWGSTGGQWFRLRENLGALDGASTAYLRYRLTSNESVQYDGAKIDDVELRCPSDSYGPDDYASMDGTSMAAPHVSGAAAVLIAARPEATTGDVRQAILDGVDPLTVLAGYTTTGGRLNLNTSLWSLRDESTVEFDTGSYTWSENAGDQVITLNRTGDVTDRDTVTVTVTGGTAISGADYTLPQGPLQFDQGQRSLNLPVHVVNDTTAEPAETLRLTTASSTPGVTIGARSSTVLTVGASDQRPDGLVSARPSAGYVGNNIYNVTGASQTTATSVPRGSSTDFYVRIYNDGNITIPIRMTASRAPGGSSIAYFIGSTNVTRAMTSTGHTTRLAPGLYRQLRVHLKALRGAVPGSGKQVTIAGSWTGDGIRKDVVKAVARVTR